MLNLIVWRTFTVTAKVIGNYRRAGASIMRVALHYAANESMKTEPVVSQKAINE
jgi:hypothetical protein